MSIKVWSVLPVLLLSACAQTVDYQRPELPVPTVWPSGSAAPDQSSAAAVQPHWSTYFVDPRLHVLIEAALKNNRDLRIAASRVMEARAQFRAAGAERFPGINLLGSGSVGITPADLSGTGTVINGERYDLALTTVSYEMDFWGRLSSLTEAARNTYLATATAQRAFQLSLISDVATTYFKLLQFDEMLRLAQENETSRQNSLALVGKGRELGGADYSEYLQAQSALEGVRSELAGLEQQRASTVNQLNFLVGAVLTDLPPGLDLDHQGLDTTLAPGLPADVLLARPDVVAAEQRLIAAQANIQAARAAFFPKIALTASVGVASIGLGTLFSGSAWSYQPSIGLPLFDGGRLEASRDLADARKVTAVAEYEKTIQQAFREVADLLSARTALAHQMRSARVNQEAQARRLDIANARYQVGLGNYLEVLDGERGLVSAQQSTLQLRRAQLDTAAQLYKALGGGA